MSSNYKLIIYTNPAEPGLFYVEVQGPDLDEGIRAVEKNKDGDLSVTKASAPDGAAKVFALADRKAAERAIAFVEATEANSDGSNWDGKDGRDFVEALIDYSGVNAAEDSDLPAEPDDEELAPIWDEGVWDRRLSRSKRGQSPEAKEAASRFKDNDADDLISIDDSVRRAGHIVAEGKSHEAGSAKLPMSDRDMGKVSRPRSGAIDDVRKLLDEARRPVQGVEAAMEKHPSQWTKEELLAVQGSELYGRPNPGQEATATAVADWYKRVFGEAPLKYDDTGRMVEAEPVVHPPKEPIEPRDARGHSLNAGVDRVARHLASASRNDGNPKSAIRSAQRAYNLIRPATALKEDGVFGPKSKQVLRDAVRIVGPKRVEEGLSLGRFATFAERVRQQGDASALASETERTFGPLFHRAEKRGVDWAKAASPRPSKPSFKRAETMALQETINDLGRDAFGTSFTPLKEDGWIGPKTTETFQGVAMMCPPDELARRYGVNLGFLAPEDL